MSLIYPIVDTPVLNANMVLENYRFEKSIGQGTFGKVKLALFVPTNKKYAVKILNKEQIQLKKEVHLVKRELEIIPKFNHLNVIHVKCIFEDEHDFYIIMDYCENGELFDYIVKHRCLSEEETALFFYQLINGVEHIHSKSVVHRDLKPENLLLTKTNVLKIIDFGLSNHFHGGDECKLLETKCGSPSYAAPEIIKGFPYNGFKTDVWCCGIITYAMICGYLPFDGEENKEIFDNVLKGEITFPESVPENVEYIIREMLNSDPEERIVVNDIKRSSLYLQGRKLFSSLYGNQTIPTFNISDRKIILTTPNSEHDDNEMKPLHKKRNNSKGKETIVLNANANHGNVNITNSSNNNSRHVKNGFRKKILQLTTTTNPAQNGHKNMRTDINITNNIYHGRFSPTSHHVQSTSNNNIIVMKKLFSHNNKNSYQRHTNNNIHNYNQHHILLSNITTPNTTPTTTVSNIENNPNVIIPRFKHKNSFKKSELKYDTSNPIKNKLGAFYLYKPSNLNQFLSPTKLITVHNIRGKSVKRDSDIMSTEPNPLFPRYVPTTRKMKSGSRLNNELEKILISNNNKNVNSTRNNNNLYVYKYSNGNTSKERNNSNDGRNCNTLGSNVYAMKDGYLPKLI